MYGEKKAKVEPYGVEKIPREERHGKPRDLFWLWFASNVGIGSYAIGYLGVTYLSLPVYAAIIGILVGNAVGGVLLALTALMGPKTGLPQMISSRTSFGHKGNYLVAFLNWISTMGWFAVNTVLGTFTLSLFYPHPLLVLVILVFIQAIIAVFGYNMIHAFEKWMSPILAAFFLFVTFLAAFHGIGNYVPSSTGPSVVTGAVAMMAFSLSYVMSWAPYASDYTRYLSEDTPGRSVAVYSFSGSVLASAWLETLGVWVSAAVPPSRANAVTGLISLSHISFIAGAVIVIGVLSANIMNLYTGAISSLALDIKLKRWQAVLLVALLGGVAAWYGLSSFGLFYENFLLLLDYWVSPWLGIIFVDFFIARRYSMQSAVSYRISALIAYISGLLMSVPFMSQSLFEGYIAQRLGGADVSYYVAFIISASVYYIMQKYL
ncbi:MAG: purine-cytosine permease family protein [Thermoprotei archaeon]